MLFFFAGGAHLPLRSFMEEIAVMQWAAHKRNFPRLSQYGNHAKRIELSKLAG
jgi:hypothetical protein